MDRLKMGVVGAGGRQASMDEEGDKEMIIDLVEEFLRQFYPFRGGPERSVAAQVANMFMGVIYHFIGSGGWTLM